MRAAPEGWWVTPRKVEVPREKPWLCRRTAMMSSSSEMPCMHSVRSAYLRHWLTSITVPINGWPAQDAVQVRSRSVKVCHTDTAGQDVAVPDKSC